MFQKIIDTTNIQNNFIHTLENGSLFSAYELDLFDEETLGLQACEHLIQSILSEIPQGRTLKVYFKSELSTDERSTHSRTQGIKDIGFVKNRVIVALEKYPGLDLSMLTLFSKSKKAIAPAIFDFGTLKDQGIAVRSLKADEISEFLPKVSEEINHSFQTIDLGSSLVSVLRLTHQSEFGIELNQFSHIKDTLPLPYLVCCSVQSIPHASAETMLRRRSKQNAISSDLKEGRKYSEAQSDLEDVALNGLRLFKFEWQCLIERNSENELRLAREEIKRRLKPIGEVYLESVGLLESIKSIYPGCEPHFTLLEKSDVMASYIPILSRGDIKSRSKNLTHSLAVHRKDESLTYLNIFDPRYESFSWCIFGRPGTGKSVLTNALTRSLIFDPNIKIIKIDVGGSHSRETSILGGIERTLSLNEPTGINPFIVLSELGPTKEAIQILASFLEVLILEENETKLSKTMKSDLERAIQHYADLKLDVLSLDGFFNAAQDLPRRDLLQRWVGTGVYGNAFLVTHDSNIELEQNKLTYFNFSKISQALDPDYAQGGLAAVMAQFNLQMLKKSEHKKRIVFIADETPFFIKKCFSFFNLSIANVRKEGHGFITVAQKTAHVVVNDDNGILDNSPNKIFFSLDGDDESFMGRTQTDSQTLEKIKLLERKQGEFSEALLKDSIGERVIRIRLSPQEYWSYTSKDEDRQKFNEARTLCPSLSTQEIIKCLSYS